METRTGRDGAVAMARALVAGGRFERELAELVARATQSQAEGTGEALRAYLDDALTPRLQTLGFQTATHANPDPRGGPLLVARRIEGDGLPTVLSYGHGDVIRGQEGLWSAGRAPFRLTREGDRLYGRGTADNKGQHLINLLALEAALAARGGRLGANLVMLYEMSEEIGSPGLAAFCRAHAAELAADVLIASDGPRLDPEVPTVFLGARGAADFELRVDLREGAHHSGNWGGLIADPAVILAHALASITDQRGAIRVPEWRPDSLTPEIRAMLKDLPLPKGPDVDADWGEPGLTPAERTYGWNSFAVLAMESGVPAAPVNAISGTARAVCQLRFVTGTDPEEIVPALRRHLDREGFGNVEIRPGSGAHFRATRSDPSGPWVRRVTGSITRTVGRTPHVLPNLAGSLPNDVFLDDLGMPTVWIPHSYGGCNQHAPDEHMLLPVAEQALGVMAGLFWDLGEPFSA